MKKVSIQNVQDLKIDRSACYDLLLQDVTQAQVVGQDLASSCTSGTLLSLHNVDLDRLPGIMTVFKVSSSKIAEVFVTNVDNFFTISGTEVQRLRVEDTIENEVQVTLQDVHLEHLERLHLAPKASVSVEKSTIGEVPEGALVLAASGNVMSEVKFLKGDDSPLPSVLLKSGADVTLTDVSGSVKVAAEECPQGPSSGPGPKSSSADDNEISSMDLPKCLTTDNYGVIIVIILVLSLVLNLLQIVFNQPRGILTRFAHIRKPVHYDSLRTGQERRCFANQGSESFPAGHQEPWKDTAVQGGMETSHHGIQVGVTINDVDEVLSGLRRRTTIDISDTGTYMSGGYTEGEVERLEFPDYSDYPHTDFKSHEGAAEHQDLQPNDWASEGQYLKVPRRRDHSFSGPWRKVE